MTGFLESTVVSKHDFDRERHLYESILDKDTLIKSKKQKKRDIKSLRQAGGNPLDADFKGPWAVYEGMEEYDSKQQTIELTEE